MRFILVFLLILSNRIYSQITPSTQGVYNKKTSTVSEESFATLIQDGAYGEVTWTKNMSSYSVSMWIDSRDTDPDMYESSFSTHYPNNNGFQINSDGNYAYEFLGIGASGLFEGSFGPNTIKTTWIHLAVVANGSNTKLYYNGSLVLTLDDVSSVWNRINISKNRIGDKKGDFYLDEIRVWEDIALSQEIIQAWMHKPLDNSHPNYSDLAVYFQMNSNSISGSTLSDASGNGNDATLNTSSGSVTNAKSNVPIVNLISGYQTDVEAIWSSTETSDSDDSDGLKMSVSSTLAEANFVVFGNNNDNSGTTSSDIVGITKRSKREWHFDESGTVTADVKIDISDATGHTGSTSAASNYKLLYASCNGCTFVELDTGDSTSGDVVTFSNVAIKDGIYAIASADSNL